MLATSEIFTRATDFPMPDVVTRYAEEQGLSKAAAMEHEKELKRFLALCAANGSKRYGMRGPVDHLWHTFLLFTQNYADFCSAVAGRFIHHIPEDRDTASTTVSREAYESFLADYEAIFGEAAPSHIWPRFAENGDESVQCQGCQGCGV